MVKENIRKLIKKMNKELGTTIFLTSHDVGDIEKLCKRVIIVNKGKIIMDDTMSNLKYHYLDRKIVEVKLKENETIIVVFENEQEKPKKEQPKKEQPNKVLPKTGF